MFQEEVISKLFKDVSFVHLKICGTPATVIGLFNTIFGQKWIGREGYVVWRPRSSDLTPSDFFLWGDVNG